MLHTLRARLAPKPPRRVNEFRHCTHGSGQEVCAKVLVLPSPQHGEDRRHSRSCRATLAEFGLHIRDLQLQARFQALVRLESGQDPLRTLECLLRNVVFAHPNQNRRVEL